MSHFAATSSAAMPCGTRPPPYRAATEAPYGSAPAWLVNIGTLLIDSMPQG